MTVSDLFSTAANADEQGVSLIHPDDPMHSSQMLESVVEEDQVHRCVPVIVLAQNLSVKYLVCKSTAYV